MPFKFITNLLRKKPKKEITGDTQDQKIHKKTRPYYEEIDVVNEPEKNQKEHESTKVVCKEITGDTKDQKIHKKPRPYDEIDLKNDQKIQKKPRQYDEVDLVNEPEMNQNENESAKVEPALNYVEVEIKPSSGATTNIVGSDVPKTQYSTIDIAATEKRKLSTQNAEET